VSQKPSLHFRLYPVAGPSFFGHISTLTFTVNTKFGTICNNNNNNNNKVIIYLFTAIGLLPGGSGYFTCKQNMKLVNKTWNWLAKHEIG
jgi:hypothetical protein